MNRKEKSQFIASLSSDLSTSNILAVALYKGLTVAEMSDLRKKARESGVSIKVTKNNLTKLALHGTPFENVAELFHGTTLIAHSSDVVASAKVLANYAKGNEKLEILGASMNGNLLNVAGVKQLALLPSMDELRAKLVGLISAPATKIARVISAPAGKVARVVGAYAAK